MINTIAHYLTVATRLFVGSADKLAWGRTFVPSFCGRG